MIIATYDIIVSSRNVKMIDKLCYFLSKHFDIKALGNINYCLGIEFTCNPDVVTMHQRGYVSDILERFGISKSNLVDTPLDPNVKLVKLNEDSTEEEKRLPYRELVGCLTYLSTSTISYAVSLLAQFNCYLKGTMNLDLVYAKNFAPIRGFVDADWGNNPIDRVSQSGFIFIMSRSPITWDSRKQRTVALFTKAEYMAMSEAAKEATYLCFFVEEMELHKVRNLVVFNDNMSALKLANNSVFHNRSKHIDIRHHYIRDAIKSGKVRVDHVPSGEMVADFLTKGLSKPKFLNCVFLSGMDYINVI